MRARFFIIGVGVLLGLLLLPLVVMAASNSDILAILAAGAEQLRLQVQDAYCAAGVVAFCP